MCQIFSATFVMKAMTHQAPSSRKDTLPQLPSIIPFRKGLYCKETRFPRVCPSQARPNPVTDGSSTLILALQNPPPQGDSEGQISQTTGLLLLCSLPYPGSDP